MIIIMDSPMINGGGTIGWGHTITISPGDVVTGRSEIRYGAGTKFSPGASGCCFGRDHALGIGKG